jgi:hypothetical protein
MSTPALLILALAPIAGSAADKKPATPATTAIKPGPLTEIPARLTVRQRSTTTVPGSDGKLQITVDDVTRGQVVSSVSHSKHGVLVGPTSMRVGDAKKFDLEGTTYQVRLKNLNNALIGVDFAEFVIGRPAEPLSERRKIEKLIATIGDLPDAVKFVRNGKERVAKDEADYLRKRDEGWKEKDLTAVAFIERLCAKSTSEKPYEVRVDGHPPLSVEYYLREKLREIEEED